MSIRCGPGQPMAAGSWPPTRAIHVRRGYLEGTSPPMQRRMRMYKYMRDFFLFLDRILLQLADKGLRLLYMSRDALAHEGDEVLRERGESACGSYGFFLLL
ncbi:uncharacterized protein TrAtP1_007974 [Trichoderma atroviride]|uniref:uncharacterized protein n=1 Tax=Hypocrea atroviridis TaxID=63577 RepID=UPI00332D63EC|nr:hypothetical protein TrAtP1_007974 [Trichoderma atroviride]